MAIDILSAFEKEPPELDFIWPGFLAGTVGALIAPGATGKSFWALEAAMAVACGCAGGDLVELGAVAAGPVLYLAGEDPVPALVRRVHAIGKYLSPPARSSIAANLTLEPVMGAGFDIMNRDCFERLASCASGWRLVVLDTLSRIHQLDENSNGDMARLIGRLEQLAASTGAAVLFLHHASKGSARDGLLDQQQAARGASALIDNARWCGFIARMTEDDASRFSSAGNGHAPVGKQSRERYVRFGISKQNYDAIVVDRWFERQEGGVLRPAAFLEVQKQAAKARDLRRCVDGF
ncbi:helicase RepA family protein [Pseudomonas aeruginosa]|uniref:helicase RepA family protein n=1 Tax=Pseudomonas aeruginosa TaxID=287 RepID=UPI0021B01BAE|nr:helicase RepA family protein [Pseudomonas aeruginosa]EKX2002122.1 AAA family ATPase [Pseudomonas aeruginosa]MCT5382820.1 helicase RepA family protein [Pseudomonas aeruginosa]MCV0242181.1 helicase RepA family protein [Pseudomonas aeruginosa]HCF1729975.1 AAA family ATPase [Pseudomonas aeruginosa]HCF4385123.1 AAA family ATPase [Pseudomonas aeruginosa]